MRYFIVNQGETYKTESKDGYVWAPILDKRGYRKSFWDVLLKIQKDDIILSNVNSKIVAFNIALSSCYDQENPFPEQIWGKQGRKVDVKYHELDCPISYSKLIDELLTLQGNKGAFNKSKRINQGYMFQLTKEQFELIFSQVTNQEIKQIISSLCSIDKREDLEEVNEERQQADKIHIGEIKSYSPDEIEKLYVKRKNEKPQRLNATSRRYFTDSKLKATCLQLHGYKCEIDAEHKTFTNVTGLHEYVECHHLIPMKAQVDFPDLWLDDLFNLVSLCPTCHARIHYGNREAKEYVFWKIYEQRKHEFKTKGFNKSKMQEIFDEYY